MSSLQHLGGDKWRCRTYVGRDPYTGQERLRSRTFHANGERAARRQLAQIEVALRAEAEQHDTAIAERAGSIGELIDDWLDIKARDSSPSTMIAYRRHADRIKARFGTTHSGDLTGREIDRWYSELLASGTTPAGIQHIHRVFRAALRWGWKYRGLPPAVTEMANPPSHDSPEMRPPTSEAVRAILASLPNTEWARALTLVAHTGMRRGEVVGLLWDAWIPGKQLEVRHSIVEVAGGIDVRKPKGKRSRRLPAFDGAELALDRQRRWQQRHDIVSPWVFPDLRTDPSGRTPRRPGWVSLMWGRHRKTIGAQGVGIHAFRHHFATAALDGGTPLSTVQAWLGHRDASTTSDVYGHRTDVGEQMGLEVIRRALGTGTTPP